MSWSLCQVCRMKGSGLLHKVMHSMTKHMRGIRVSMPRDALFVGSVSSQLCLPCTVPLWHYSISKMLKVVCG